jgi:hypothetical protein
MVSYYTANKNLQAPARGDYVDDWQTPVNRDWNYLDKALGGAKIISASSGSQTLTSGIDDLYSYIPLTLQIEGAMSANVIYTIPALVGGQWIVRNYTSDSSGGPYTVTFRSAGSGTSVIVPRGYSSVINSDGYNMTFADSRLPSAAGSNRQVQYNNSGVLGASSTFVYTASDQLGVGTDTPTANLTVQVPEKPTNVNLIPEDGTSNSDSNGVGFNVGFNGTNWTTSGDGTDNGGSYIGSAFTDGDIQFVTVPSTGGTDQSISNATFQTYERARLTSDGKLGIGTAAPSEKLEVDGIIYSTSGGIKFPDDTIQTTASTLKSGTTQTASGQTAITFTGIPAGTKRITMMFNGVSTNGNNPLLVQIGYDSTFTATYVSGSNVNGRFYGYSVAVMETAGYTLSLTGYGDTSSALRYGAFTINLLGSNIWVANGGLNTDTATGFVCACSGSGILTSVLDRIRVISLGGADTFDAGSINILYE